MVANVADTGSHRTGDRVPVVLRRSVALVWLGGAAVNAFWTVRNANFYGDFEELSPVPLIGRFFADVVSVHPVVWTWLLVAFEVGLGILMLGRGRLATLGVLGSTLWSGFLFFVAWPWTLMMGPYTLLNAWLLQRTHGQCVSGLRLNVLQWQRPHPTTPTTGPHPKEASRDDA
jgi:hypothetical protein